MKKIICTIISNNFISNGWIPLIWVHINNTYIIQQLRKCKKSLCASKRLWNGANNIVGHQKRLLCRSRLQPNIEKTKNANISKVKLWIPFLWPMLYYCIRTTYDYVQPDRTFLDVLFLDNLVREMINRRWMHSVLKVSSG